MEEQNSCLGFGKETGDEEQSLSPRKSLHCEPSPVSDTSTLNDVLFFWLVQTVPGYKPVNFCSELVCFIRRRTLARTDCRSVLDDALVEGLPQSLEKLVELGSVRTIWCSFAHAYLKLATQCILAMPVLINKRGQRELVGTYAHGTNLSCLLQKGCLWGKVPRAMMNSHV